MCGFVRRVAAPAAFSEGHHPRGAGSAIRGSDGLTYHDYTLPGLEPGKPLSVDLTYKRTSNEASIPGTPASGAVGNTAGTGGAASGQSQSGAGTNTTALVMGALVLGVLAVLLVFSGMGGSSGPTGRAARRHGRGTVAASGTADARARARARDLLLEGKISEGTYRLLIAELDAEEGR